MEHKNFNTLCALKSFINFFFFCSLCNTKLTQRKGLLRHERTIHGDESHQCEICNKSFNRKDSLIRHSKTHNKQPLMRYDINPDSLIKPLNPTNGHHPHLYNMYVVGVVRKRNYYRTKNIASSVLR